MSRWPPSLLLLLLACARAPGAPPRPAAASPVPSDSVTIAEPPAPAPAPRSEAELQAALTEDLDDIDAYAELARLYHARSRSQPSYRLLTRQLLAQAFAALARQGRDSADLRLTRALLAADLGDIDAARADLEAGLALAPDDPALRRARAWLALHHREFARARDVLRDMSQSPADEKDPEVWLALGVTEANLGRSREAEAAYYRALALDGADVRPYYDLGLLYMRIASGEQLTVAERDQYIMVARNHFIRFIAGADHDRLRREIQRARDIVAAIDEELDRPHTHPPHELIKQLEEQLRREEEEERRRLLELERQIEAAEATERARLLELERRDAER